MSEELLSFIFGLGITLPLFIWALISIKIEDRRIEREDKESGIK